MQKMNNGIMVLPGFSKNGVYMLQFSLIRHIKPYFDRGIRQL